MVNSEKNPNRTTKPTKTGEKRPFDLTDLDEAHRQDMADSARRQDHCIELEVKRTELELERERNKKRKLELRRNGFAWSARIDRTECGVMRTAIIASLA